MINYFNKAFFSSLIVILLFFSLDSFAGTTGKIAGIVLDTKTGEPLVGCNIVIEGTPMGAATDQDGYYFIINVKPGKYVVMASMLGYSTMKMTNVRVMIDLTTKANFDMKSSMLELGEAIIVVAERPMVQKDITSKQTIVSSSEIANMAVDNFQEVLTTKAGFTTDADGEIHVRGGRSGEIAYMIDGMIVDDPLYGGFNSMVNEDAIDEMVVLSGTFNAEYGDAMSSIVNIVTKEGSEEYHGKFEYGSAMLNESPYRKKNPYSGFEDSYEYVEKNVIDEMEFDLGQLDIPVTGTFNLSLNGPVPFSSKLFFFMSGRYKNENSYLPHGYNFERDGFLKLTYRFSPSVKIAMSGQSTEKEFQRYSHSWKYYSDHQNYNIVKTNRFNFVLTHTINQNLFYTFNFSRFENNLQIKVGDKLPAEYERGETEATVYFYKKGDDEDYSDNHTITYIGKGDVTFQANNHHQFKAGTEIKKYEIDVYEESEPWPNGAQFKDEYSMQPYEAALYIQDKIEFDYLILNIGLRYDLVNSKATMWPDINRFGYFDENNNWVLIKEKEVDAEKQLSPRIGLAHPISEQAMLHFSYGHFFQNPNYNSLYYNKQKDLTSTMPLVGNPNVKPQKTVAYETGIKYQLNDNWALDFSAWYKDITDLLSTIQISYLSQNYVVFYNSDYASVKGFDLTLRNRYNKYISGTIDYTYSVAKGNNSQPRGGYFDAFAGEEPPHQEYYLDFDQRHDLAVNFNLAIPENDGPEFVGIKPFENMNINLLFQAGSGLPYTPYVDPSLRIDINSARKPYTSTLDLSIRKNVKVSGITTAIFMDVTNVFNTENVVHVYSRTGKPYDTGEPHLVGSSDDADHNPLHVGPPRIIKAGFQIIW